MKMKLKPCSQCGSDAIHSYLGKRICFDAVNVFDESQEVKEGFVPTLVLQCTHCGIRIEHIYPKNNMEVNAAWNEPEKYKGNYMLHFYGIRFQEETALEQRLREIESQVCGILYQLVV